MFYLKTNIFLFVVLLVAVVIQSLSSNDSCFTPTSGVVYITSYHGKWYADIVAMNEQLGTHFSNTILETFPHNNLIIYHEEDVPIVHGACMIDLRLAFPWLQDELSRNESGLNSYYRLAEYTDPLWNPKVGDVKNGHSLFFKVLSIYHAVQNSPNGFVVFWLDTDVTFRENLPEDVLVWIRNRDLVYIPFVINYHLFTGGIPSNGFDLFDLQTSEGQSAALLSEFWRIESGLFALTVNEKTEV